MLYKTKYKKLNALRCMLLFKTWDVYNYPKQCCHEEK